MATETKDRERQDLPAGETEPQAEDRRTERKTAPTPERLRAIRAQILRMVATVAEDPQMVLVDSQLLQACQAIHMATGLLEDLQVPVPKGER